MQGRASGIFVAALLLGAFTSGCAADVGRDEDTAWVSAAATIDEASHTSSQPAQPAEPPLGLVAYIPACHNDWFASRSNGQCLPPADSGWSVSFAMGGTVPTLKNYCEYLWTDGDTAPPSGGPLPDVPTAPVRLYCRSGLSPFPGASMLQPVCSTAGGCGAAELVSAAPLPERPGELAADPPRIVVFGGGGGGRPVYYPPSKSFWTPNPLYRIKLNTTEYAAPAAGLYQFASSPTDVVSVNYKEKATDSDWTPLLAAE